MALTVYHKNNEPFFTLKEYSFNGILMGENKITSTAYSPDKLIFEVGSYVMRNGIKYSVFKRISGTKTARSGEGIEDAMKYDLIFHSPAKLLETVNFDDYVSKDDTNQYYTGTPTFDFYNNVNELAIRLQANLDRFFGVNIWIITVDASVVLEEKQVASSNLNVSSGLNLAQSVFGLDYFINGNNIQIGGVGANVSQQLSYGKGNGLYEISRSFGSDKEIITRMKVYGGSRNLPQDYLRDAYGKGRYFNQLMIPNFAITGIDYVDAPVVMIEEYGIRESSITFEDIFPSIEEVVYGGNRIDEIVSVDAIDLESDYFTVEVNDLGFDINDYLTSKSAVLSIKGSNSDNSPTYLGGYEFEIVDVTGNKIRMLKNQSDNNILPDNITTVRAGDRFVLLYIEMPAIYVTNAENKLQVRAAEYFTGDGDVDLSYIIKPDEKFIAIQGIESELIEGNRISVEDSDLEVDNYFTIQSVNIKYDKKILPTYDIKLSNVKAATLTEKINTVAIRQNTINVSTVNSSSTVAVNSNLKTIAVKDIMIWE